MTYTIACCNLFLASNSFPKANDRNSQFSLPIEGELVAFLISVTKFFTEAAYGTKGFISAQRLGAQSITVGQAGDSNCNGSRVSQPSMSCWD